MPEGKGTYASKRGRPPTKVSKPSKPSTKPKPNTNNKDSPFDNLKKGALSKTLGIPEEKNIPKSLLQKIKKAVVGTTMEYKGKKIKVTKLLQKRVNFAINFAK